MQFGIVATAFLALLLLPSAALSQTGLDFDPKKGDIESEDKEAGKKNKAAVEESVIHLKFFTPKGPLRARLVWRTQEKRRWIKQAKWWIEKTNDNCKIKKIEKVIFDGRDKQTLPAKKAHFAEEKGVLTASDPDEKRFFIGKEALADMIGQNKKPRWFFIGIFKTVRVSPKSLSSAGSVPGLYIPPNVMAASQNMENVGNRRHELGHLMGLKHSDGGLMHKTYPPKGASKKSDPIYGDGTGGVDDFKQTWCSKIAKHLGL